MSVNFELAGRLVEFLNDQITYDQEMTSALLWGRMPDDLTPEEISAMPDSLRHAQGLLRVLDGLCGGSCIEPEVQADGQVVSFRLNGKEIDDSPPDSDNSD